MSADQTMQTLAELVPIGSRVLDLGCGDGRFLAYLQTHR
ncbi:MAG: methionine biosynthesis protein MetW, partial [Burkholderiaceae bacterium]